MGKKLICTVVGQSWQHVLLGTRSLHRFERGLDELLQKKSLQHHYDINGEVLLENPTTVGFPLGAHQCFGHRTKQSQKLLHPTCSWVCDSHQQASPAWLLNPEVKARDQKSCQRMLPEGLRKSPPAPMEQNKRQNIHTANLYDMIVTQMIASHQTSYLISLWGRYLQGVTSLSHS